MKSILTLIFTTVFFSNSFINHFSYDEKYVQIITNIYKGDKFIFVKMRREGERIKAKYFASKEFGNTVYERYSEWSKGKNIILACGAAYFDWGIPKFDYKKATPVGITIDNGNVVSYKKSDRGNGLVIVYATGGIACSNIKQGKLKMKCSGESFIFNVNQDKDLNRFIECSKEVNATVFQQHLLAYDGKLNQLTNFSTEKKERRFLVVGYDENNKLFHIVIHYPTSSSLKDAAEKVFNFLMDQELTKIEFMVNLDTGYQDVFKLYDTNGSEKNDIKGTEPLTSSVNLLVYYYE